MSTERRRCPHEQIEFCPLYIASHDSSGPGCVDEKATPFGNCKVDRGAADYGAMVSQCDKFMVAERALAEQAFDARKARDERIERQKRAGIAGLH